MWRPLWSEFWTELTQHVEWFWWSVGLVAAGLAWMVWVGQVNTLTCVRDEARRGVCTLTRVTAWGRSVTEFPVGELLGAEVEVSESSDWTGYRLRLLLERGPLPVATSFDTVTGSGSHSARAAQINAFVADRSARSLTVQDNTWVHQGLCGTGVALLGAVLLALLFRQSVRSALRHRPKPPVARRRKKP